MTEEELQELEKLCAAATPGPWEAVQEYPDKDFAEETAIRSTSPEAKLGGVVIGTMWYDGLHLACSLDDSAFIAAARNALPKLIEEARKNRSALKEAADICLSRTRYNYNRASEFTPGSEQYNFYAAQGDEAEYCADLISEHARRSGRFETTE